MDRAHAPHWDEPVTPDAVYREMERATQRWPNELADTEARFAPLGGAMAAALVTLLPAVTPPIRRPIARELAELGLPRSAWRGHLDMYAELALIETLEQLLDESPQQPAELTRTLHDVVSGWVAAAVLGKEWRRRKEGREIRLNHEPQAPPQLKADLATELWLLGQRTTRKARQLSELYAAEPALWDDGAETARRLGVTHGRVSQLRAELKRAARGL